jgi:magnesium chelatase subunit D
MTGRAAWSDAVRALTLFAADPAGLGIAVRAGAGPVRDRYLALLRSLLSRGVPIRRLPLHAGDDRLLGGLDLAATLQAGRPIAQTGLLVEADGGILLLAMAERIESGMAARLCAVLDDGVVTLQREGLSRVMPARFGVVALDEGADPDERPPAPLLDRIAFHVDLTEVSLKDVADSGPPSIGCPDGPQAGDKANHTGPGEQDRACRDSAVECLCHAALALGIDSPRASLFALRAARGAAALAGRDRVTETDLALAARLVLAPRATRFPPPDVTEAPHDTEPDRDTDEAASDQNDALPDAPVADLVLDAATAALPPDLLARLASRDGGRGAVKAAGRAGQFKTSMQRGRPIGTRQGDPKGCARLHVLATLKAAAPWQRLRQRTAEAGKFEVRREDFRVMCFRQRIGTTTVFAVDASGSAAMARLGEAKGAVELLLADCYVRRDQVALLAFRGQGAVLLLPPTGSLLRAKRSLATLPGGGATPLATGIDAARTLAETIRRAGRTPVITLLTDGRANIARDGAGGRPRAEADAADAARAIRVSGVAALLVDTSPRPNPFGRHLAAEMDARYVPLPYADAALLSRAVRSAGIP